MFQAILIEGVILGGMYAILAVGFSLVFGVARILNLAHSGFYMVAGYLIFIMAIKIGIPLFLSCFFAIIITGVLGIISYKFLIDRVKEHEIAVMIITIALAIIFQEALQMVFGASDFSIPHFYPGFMEILDIRVSYQSLFSIGATVMILSGLWILLLKTKFGNAIRSISQDKEVANLMGINVGRMCLLIMGFTVALAGIAGAVIIPLFTLTPHMWMPILVGVLAAVVLGGLGSLKGSIIAAFILGYVETMVVFLVPGGSYLKGAASLSIMVIMLLIRPEGLFGAIFEEERL